MKAVKYALEMLCLTFIGLLILITVGYRLSNPEWTETMLFIKLWYLWLSIGVLAIIWIKYFRGK